MFTLSLDLLFVADFCFFFILFVWFFFRSFFCHDITVMVDWAQNTKGSVFLYSS